MHAAATSSGWRISGYAHHSAMTSRLVLYVTPCPPPAAAGQLVLGLSSGCMQGLDMATGQVAHISSSRQQEHAISSLACCSQRLQFVACSSDHCARLYDSRYRLHAVLEHGRPQATCCFLNTEGDLLLATGRRLLVVRAESYLPRKREWPAGSVGANCVSRCQPAMHPDTYREATCCPVCFLLHSAVCTMNADPADEAWPAYMPPSTLAIAVMVARRSPNACHPAATQATQQQRRPRTTGPPSAAGWQKRQPQLLPLLARRPRQASAAVAHTGAAQQRA